MPSCAVKSCRNHSGFMKKNQGITFHRFPKANDAWRRDWIQIMRECRNENDWNPSKSTVICSVHFHANDLYTTKGGFLRVVLYAVPKKFLSEPCSIQEEQLAEPNISSVVRESLPPPVIEAVISSAEEQLILEQTGSRRITSPIQTCISLSTNDCFYSTATDRKSLTLTETIASSSEQQLAEQFGHPTSLPQNLFKIEAVERKVDFEQPLSGLYSARTRHLKENIMKMQILMQKQKKKIKTLNQKVRRLRNRNKFLKGILKILKEENDDDTVLFNRVQENVAAADPFVENDGKLRSISNTMHL